MTLTEEGSLAHSEEDTFELMMMGDEGPLGACKAQTTARTAEMASDLAERRKGCMNPKGSEYKVGDPPIQLPSTESPQSQPHQGQHTACPQELKQPVPSPASREEGGRRK